MLPGEQAFQIPLRQTHFPDGTCAPNLPKPCVPQDIYANGPDDDVGQLQLLTSPLAATEEVLALYAGGLVPVELAMPAVLNAIGSSKEDIDSALEKAVKERDEKEAQEKQEQAGREEERKLNMERQKKEIAQIGKEPVAEGGSGGNGSSGNGSSGSGV